MFGGTWHREYGELITVISQIYCCSVLSNIGEHTMSHKYIRNGLLPLVSVLCRMTGCARPHPGTCEEPRFYRHTCSLSVSDIT